MNLILFGFKSCGKTTLGKKIADQMKRPFIDTDRLVEELYKKRTGRDLNCREIAKQVGEEGFRALESDAVLQLKKMKDTIIALGGGLILIPGIAEMLAKVGTLVYLKVSKGTLKERILKQPLHTFLDPMDAVGSFERMYAERQPKYEKILALSVDVETKTQDEIIQEICALIQKEENLNG